MTIRNFKIIPMAVAMSVLLAGCVTSGGNQMGGALVGGTMGGLAGSQFGSGEGRLAMTAAGAMLGALAGSSAGESLDRADAAYYNQARYQAPVYYGGHGHHNHRY